MAGTMSTMNQQAATTARMLPKLHLPAGFRLGAGCSTGQLGLPVAPRYHLPEEEIGYGPACWMRDYLRRSGAAGFFLPLSGGADSSSTAAIVGIMCQLVMDAATGPEADAQVVKDVLKATGAETLPGSPEELASLVWCTHCHSALDLGKSYCRPSTPSC
jgi:NAD+ synthase (glutamine-hydrolysing)